MAWQPIGGLFGQEAQPFGDEVVYRAASKAGLFFQAFAIVCRCCSSQRRVERHTACLFGGCFGWIIFFGGYTDRRFNRMRPSIAPLKRHQAG